MVRGSDATHGNLGRRKGVRPDSQSVNKPSHGRKTAQTATTSWHGPWYVPDSPESMARHDGYCVSREPAVPRKA